MAQPILPTLIKGFHDANGEFVCTGSYMGRNEDLPENMHVACKLYLRNILTDGDYDSGGVYWGGGTGEGVYWAHAPASDECEELNLFVRAKNRKKAKRKIIERLPKAIFFT